MTIAIGPIWLVWYTKEDFGPIALPTLYIHLYIPISGADRAPAQSKDGTGTTWNQVMDSEDLTLKILAEELRLYKPPHSIPIQQSGSDSESARRKPNRAAVLICLSQGENGDLHVILTKRSSTLSSHSGQMPS